MILIDLMMINLNGPALRTQELSAVGQGIHTMDQYLLNKSVVFQQKGNQFVVFLVDKECC
jgi:hypothetical protein